MRCAQGGMSSGVADLQRFGAGINACKANENGIALAKAGVCAGGVTTSGGAGSLYNYCNFLTGAGAVWGGYVAHEQQAPKS